MDNMQLKSKDLSFSVLRENASAIVKEKKYMTLEKAYDTMAKVLESDQTLKEKEDKLAKISLEERKSREFYRENFRFYYRLIRQKLLSEGIFVYKETETGSEEVPTDEVANYITSGYVGFDCLEDAINDPSITDIYCISYDTIFVEKNGKNEKYPKTFRSERFYNNFIDRLLRVAGKALDSGENKIVDFEIYGNRGNVIHDMISTKGKCLTLRKHMEEPIKLEQMIGGVLDEHLSELLGLCIQGETNLIYGGITGSGKTTTIRALLDYYIPQLGKRALVLEDTQELFLKNPHTVDLTTFVGTDAKNSITLRDLNISALRMKPKYIIVGEVRGPEAESAVEGMETGHSTIFTMHCGNVWNIINRLVTKYLMQMPTLGMEVVERIIGAAVNFVAIQDDIPEIGRKITSIHEISYDFDTNKIVATPIVKFDIRKKEWVYFNEIGDNSISTMTRRGIPIERIDRMNQYIRDKIKENEVA